jgi:hypothetical protein
MATIPKTAQRATPRNQTSVNPADQTALRKQQLEIEHAAELAERAAELTMQNAQYVSQVRDEVLDFSDIDTPLPEYSPQVDDTTPVVECVIKFDIDQMAFGMKINRPAELDPETGAVVRPAELGGIRFLSFTEGRRYKLPRALYNHLDERGYVRH